MHLEGFPEVMNIEPLFLVYCIPPALGMKVLHDQYLEKFGNYMELGRF